MPLRIKSASASEGSKGGVVERRRGGAAAVMSVLMLILSANAWGGANAGTSHGFSRQPRVQRFIDRLVERDGFDRGRLERLFSKVKTQPGAIRMMNHPAEAMPWFEYRRLLLTSRRIHAGRTFLRMHRVALERARSLFGVPPSVVTAIIGVETFYGKRLGSWPEFDTLATLAFDYPSRGHFFRYQLRQYLLFARKAGFDPLEPKGSYAGAMGLGQFMPSAYRHYAVGAYGRKVGDFWKNPDDAIPSVANYLARNGWHKGEMIAVRAHVAHAFPANRRIALSPKFTLAQLRSKGIAAEGRAPRISPLGLIRLQGRDSARYWITAHDFYVIMRYNPSPLYAMAVAQLAAAIRSGRTAGTTSESTRG